MDIGKLWTQRRRAEHIAAVDLAASQPAVIKVVITLRVMSKEVMASMMGQENAIPPKGM